jgi:uncharacterized protein (TIGR03437 family)
MRTLLRWLAWVAATGAAFAAPEVALVRNPASQIPRGFPTYGLAPGGFMEILGRDMGPAQRAVARGLPLVTELAGVQVEISVGERRLNAYLRVVQANRVLAILPSETPVGETASIRVIVGGQASAPYTTRIVTSAFGFFTLNGTGEGPILVLGTDMQPRTIFNPLQPGEIAVALGTGGGVTAQTTASALPSEPTLEGILEAVKDAPEVNQAGLTEFALRFLEQLAATPLYFGPVAPGMTGVVFRVPDNNYGCWVPVQLALPVPHPGMLPSNLGKMSIKRPPRPGIVAVGEQDVCEAPIGDTRQERARKSEMDRSTSGGFFRYFRRLIDTSQPGQPVTNQNVGVASIEEEGYQGYKDYEGYEFGVLVFFFAYVFGVLDDPLTFRTAGDLFLTLPNGVTGRLPQSTTTPGLYSAGLPPEAFVSGTMRMRSTGSSFVGPFTVEMPFPLPVPALPANVPVRGLSSTGVIRRSAGPLEVDVSVFPPAGRLSPTSPQDEHYRVWLRVTNEALGGGAQAVARCPGADRTCSIPQWALEMLPTGTGFLEIARIPNRPIRAPLVPIAAAADASLTGESGVEQISPRDVFFGYGQLLFFTYIQVRVE